MDDRTRDLAPVADRAWEEIEEQARATLTACLAARKLVDVSGPHGWDRSAVNPGRVDIVDQGPGKDGPSSGGSQSESVKPAATRRIAGPADARRCQSLPLPGTARHRTVP